MREIKFRAWNMADKWYEQNDVFLSMVNGVIHAGKPEQDELFEIQLFTGLTDKNGKEIYEGDIISSYKKRNGQRTQLRVITFGQGTKNAGFNIGKNAAHEVIGNIKENPELLSAHGG